MITKFWFVFAIAGSTTVWGGSPELPSSKGNWRQGAEHNEAAVLDYLLPVVYSSGKAVRIYYRGACRAGAQDPVPFPAVKAQSPSKDKTGLAAVREIFQNEKNVIVTEEPAGIIRIRIGEVPTAILQTKLSSLTLDRLQQYNPRDAIAALENTREMEMATRSLGMAEPVKLAGTVAEPQENLPHLPAVIKDVTVEQALDLVAKTWAGEGIVIYGVCGDPVNKAGQKPFLIDYHGAIVPKDER
jgi:hypothetical protein